MNQYIRLGIFKLEEVFPYVIPRAEARSKRLKKKDLDKIYLNHKVKMSSARYDVFKEKGTKCVSCGIEGSFFALEKCKSATEKDNMRGHFNLYALNKQGEEILMTKDHIIPLAKGGKNNINNYQPMCTICNGIKKDTLGE